MSCFLLHILEKKSKMFVEKKLLAAPTGVAEDRILVAQAIFK
jgi:hypothetical protein